MAWAERLPGGRWRGGWRAPDSTKCYTKKATHPEHPYPTKKIALDAAKAEEVGASRKASISKGKASAAMKWGDFWDANHPERPDTETARTEAFIVSKYLRPRWGEVDLNQIYHRDVKSWALGMLVGREVSYARKIYGVFRASINRAVDLEILDASPCVNVKLPKPSRTSKPIKDDTLLEQVRPFLKQCYQDLVDFGYEVGLRPGEMFGLHVDAVDRGTGWLSVNKTLVTRRHLVRHAPKDEDSRDVPLTEKALEILDRATAGRDLKAGCGLPHYHREKLWSKPCQHGLAFVNEDGNPISAWAFYRALERACERAGVARIKPYDSRHWYITRALEGGLDIATVAYLVGHSDVKQTQDYVFRTASVRDRVRAALGGRRELAVLPRVELGNDLDTPLERPRTVRHG